MIQTEKEKFITYILRYIQQKINNPIEYLENNRKNWVKQNILEKIDDLKNKFTNIQNPFLKDIYLKFLISDKLKLNLDNGELKRWIVQDWGGIKTHKDFDTLDNAMKLKSFNRISSWSKIASFEDINNYIIYDSRVIYSLNWIIHKFNKETNGSQKYLFQPDGRNRLLTLLPVDSIINFDNISQLDKTKKGDKIFEDIYIPKQHCYNHACKLMKNINEILFQGVQIKNLTTNPISAEQYPFFTEMLLFQMADDIIFEDIKQSIKINIEGKNK